MGGLSSEVLAICEARLFSSKSSVRVSEARYKDDLVFSLFLLFMHLVVLIVSLFLGSGFISAVSRTHGNPTAVSEPCSLIFITNNFQGVFNDLFFWFMLLIRLVARFFIFKPVFELIIAPNPDFHPKIVNFGWKRCSGNGFTLLGLCFWPKSDQKCLF